MKFAVVAVGYNRPRSMERLLNSVIEADYQGDTVDLIISLDKGERQTELVDLAEKIPWSFGDKIIRAFSERQGLRSHILQCGDLTDTYDAVAVLEDDLIVSKGFYAYCKQMIAYYGHDHSVAGISLYKHRINPGVRRPFEPEEGSYDVYFMQVAQSWGQCWSSRMWAGFRQWYQYNGGDIVADESFPRYVSKWNDASWLKYYNKYVVEKDLFYVYPYKSLTTNHTDVGEHSFILNNDYQVPLLSNAMEYRCCPVLQGIQYDAFFERIDIQNEFIAKFQGKVLLDLMGTRHCFDGADYLISIQRLPFKVVEELQLRYRPIEMNVVLHQTGKGIFVYDLHKCAKKPKSNSKLLVAYDVRGIKWERTMLYSVSGFLSMMANKVRRVRSMLLPK